MSDRDRNEARLRATIEAVRPALAAASEAAHAIEPADAEEAGFDRIVQLGYITDAAAMLCGPKARVLADRSTCCSRSRSRTRPARGARSRTRAQYSMPKECITVYEAYDRVIAKLLQAGFKLR